ncbi:hypothetical protein [Ruegeria sp. Alg231-54]|uniref:hypothetical protein n=1 Tax=Ruegeria sp. Alg231-54 TaxID=1922221 RepID=UPI00131F07ED|nr:hypothetical protein [Ruegeria sp. Alg231-54]
MSPDIRLPEPRTKTISSRVFEISFRQKRVLVRSHSRFFLLRKSSGSDEPFTCTNGASDHLQTKTAVTTVENWLPVNVAAFDNLPRSITDLTGCPPHAPASVTPALYRLFFFVSLFVLPHGDYPIEPLSLSKTHYVDHDSTSLRSLPPFHVVFGKIRMRQIANVIL